MRLQAVTRAMSLGASVAMWPVITFAHAAAPVTPDRLWQNWNFDPVILGGIGLTALLYGRGVGALWRRAGRGNGIATWRVACFAAGILALCVALISPLDRLGITLFSAHMVQHLVLILVAAPLLVLGEPLAPMIWSLPLRWRRAVARARPTIRVVAVAIGSPLLVWSLHLLALWIWHLPALYEGALRDDAVHAAEHASFLVTAILFWWIVVRAGPRRRLGLGAAVLAVFVMGAQGGVLGALIALAPQPWYATHAQYASLWGLTPLEDQQLAGFIMWMPAGVIYLLAGLVLFAAWLRRSDRRPARQTAEPVEAVVA